MGITAELIHHRVLVQKTLRIQTACAVQRSLCIHDLGHDLLDNLSALFDHNRNRCIGFGVDVWPALQDLEKLVGDKTCKPDGGAVAKMRALDQGLVPRLDRRRPIDNAIEGLRRNCRGMIAEKDRDGWRVAAIDDGPRDACSDRRPRSHGTDNALAGCPFDDSDEIAVLDPANIPERRDRNVGFAITAESGHEAGGDLVD